MLGLGLLFVGAGAQPEDCLMKLEVGGGVVRLVGAGAQPKTLVRVERVGCRILVSILGL